MKATNNTTLTLGLLAVLAGGVGVLSGCRGDRSEAPPRQFFPDMDDSPKWKPQSESNFFADKRTMRPAPANVVAFGRTNFAPTESWGAKWAAQREELLREGTGVFKGEAGVNPDGTVKYLDRIPIEVSEELIRVGQAKFNVFCATCHGYDGAGKGMVGQAWSYALPNFYDAKYKDPSTNQGKDGYLFHVARYGVIGPDGKQKMPGYAHAINEREAWGVVAYIRTLQAARNVPLNDVPESERRALEEKMRAAGAASPAAAAPAPSTPAPNTPSTPAAGGAK